MSTKNNQVETKKKIPIITSFSVRNIKKEFVKFKSESCVTKQAHLEVDEGNKIKIVKDRNRDWFELANKDADKVGLTNILELARKRGQDFSAFAFKDEEAVSLSGLDPMNPQDMQKKLNSNTPLKKLEGTAKQLGLTVDELVKAVAEGTLSTILKEKSVKKEESADGKE